ncbi:MAG: CxxC-x17-CxxC domain-containing protein [Candidatus Omnitrophota bacterium]|jgi:CxxC-x17-CxxC domain-containing protein
MKKHSENEADILGFIAKIHEQLALLDRKLDLVIAKVMPPKPPEVKPFPKPFQQSGNTHPQTNQRQDNRFRERPMFKTVCADCRKQCEVPFRPSGDRPVYCQDCFSRRKNASSFKPNIDNRLRQTSPSQMASFNKPQVTEAKKPVIKKRPVEKKKPIAKKRKGK